MDESAESHTQLMNLYGSQKRRLINMRLKAAGNSGNGCEEAGAFLYWARVKSKIYGANSVRRAGQHWFSYGADTYVRTSEERICNALAQFNPYAFAQDPMLLVERDWEAPCIKRLDSFASGFWLSELKTRPVRLLEDKKMAS